MRKLILLSLVLSSLFLFGTIATAQTAVAPTTIQPAATATVRHDCGRLYTRAEHRWYARKYYGRNGHLTGKQAHWLWKLRFCQRSNVEQAGALKLEHALKARRDARLAMYCGSPACNRRLGMHMAVLVYGRGADGCIDYIVTHESGWLVRKFNLAGSGAYGIPQALPGSKMASAGRDWATSAKTQIRWMLGYVRKFGGMCGAAAYWRVHHSY